MITLHFQNNVMIAHPSKPHTHTHRYATEYFLLISDASFYFSFMQMCVQDTFFKETKSAEENVKFFNMSLPTGICLQTLHHAEGGRRRKEECTPKIFLCGA
jgi:hypothetical protein